MKIREMFVPYLAIGLVLGSFVLFVFGEERASGFLVNYTIAYGVAMVVLQITE